MSAASSDGDNVAFASAHMPWYEGATLIGSGQINGVPGGSSGFHNAKLQSIPLALLGPDPVPFGIADTLNLKVSVRNACTGSGKNSGTARLWFNDAAASSRFDATIEGTVSNYFLRSGSAPLKSFLL